MNHILRITLLALMLTVVATSFSQGRRKSKPTKPALVFADSASLQRRADSLQKLAVAADTTTASDAAVGLKSILLKAANNATAKLSADDGFLKNPLVKIGVPTEDQKQERGLRSFGMGKQIDIALASMNHAAEEASKNAMPVFSEAIQNMNADALQLLKSSDSSGTVALHQAAFASLTANLRPIVTTAIQKSGADINWLTAFTTYNKFGLNKTNTDLTGYLTDKTVTGLLTQMAVEEQQIRTSEETKSSPLLKKLNKQ